MADQQLVYALKGDSSGASAAFKDVAAGIQRTEDRVEKLSESFQKLQAKQASATDKASSSILAQAHSTGLLANSYGMLSGAVQVAAGNLVSFAATEVTGMLKEQAAAALEYGASIQDMSDRFGISNQDFQIFVTWAEMSGSSVESLAGAISKLETKVADGDKDLAKYGVTAMDGKEAFLQLVRAVEAAPSHLEKVNIASAAFGKSWAEMMPVLNAGAQSLSDMASNADLIDDESIQKLAEMDDKLTELKSSFRTLGAEIVATFSGSDTFSAIDALREKLKKFNDTFVRRERDNWVERLGGRYVAQGEYDLSNLKSLEGLSSKDIAPLLRGQRINTGMLMDGQSVKIDSAVMLSAADAYNKALEREELEAQRSRLQKAEDTSEAAQRRKEDKDRDEADKKRKEKEKEAKAEIDFQREMGYTYEVLQAQETERQLAQIQAKYDALIQKHKNYRNSILAIEKNRSQELVNQIADDYKKEFNAKAKAEANARYAQEDSLVQDYSKSQNDVYTSTYGTTRNFGNIGLNEAATKAPESLQKSWEATDASPDKMTEQYKKYLMELQKATDAVANHIADLFAGPISQAIVEAFTAGKDPLVALGEASSAILKKMLTEITEIIVKWAFLKLLSKMTDTVSNPGGLGAFLGSAIGGHADGTANSPGGLKFLSENGTEFVQTPGGFSGFLPYGLYQIPAGTKVQKAESINQAKIEIRQYIYGNDPQQIAEQSRRILSEELPKYIDSSYRGR